jgi:hypothetical protein
MWTNKYKKNPRDVTEILNRAESRDFWSIKRLLEHKENINSDYHVSAKNKHLLPKLVSLFHQLKTK